VSVLVVPPLEEEPWPTLGPLICDFIEERACFGPGDLRGEPAVIDVETRAIFYRAYQVFPQGHPRAGKRRFNRAAISLRKGSAKTEKAAWIAFCELHPEGPVRCDGFDANGNPVGRPVRDPYIPMVAYNQEQVEELAYGALLCICQEGPDAGLFDVTLDRIRQVDGDGKAEPMASSPNANDGARTTFQHFDETHRMLLPRIKEAHSTMLMNIPKRPRSEPWSLETTTTYGEGEQSVAEGTHQYAELVAKGKAKDATLFFFHREATVREDEDLADVEQRKAAIREASGPAIAQWEDFEGQVESISALYDQPDTERSYWERVWLNRRVSSSKLAFDLTRWRVRLADPDFRVPEGDPIAVGFDGARFRDAAGFIGTHMETGFQWPLGVWEKPEDLPKGVEWEITDDQVDGALADIMRRFKVVLLYGDPPRFEANLARWSGLYGDRIREWYTNRPKPIGQAMRAYRTAMTSEALSHSGDETFTRHIGNARRGNVRVLDDDDTPLWTIYKKRPDSTEFIDLAMAGCLSWQARLDALAQGGWQRRKGGMIVRRGVPSGGNSRGPTRRSS
jgi:hypothetical protein